MDSPLRKKFGAVFYLVFGCVAGLGTMYAFAFYPFNAEIAGLKAYVEKIRASENALFQKRQGVVSAIDDDKSMLVIEYFNPWVSGTSRENVFLGRDTRIEKGVVFIKNGVIYSSGKNAKSSLEYIRVGESIETRSLIKNNRYETFYIRHGDVLF
ncbi:hypothetical protein HYW58_02215 [Candidatus Kaiserbacteria bacterium]|nr:hypothetical protein [Candidatus Kaiserbacteria bacterium]